jgi:elongator complex protein 5
MLAFRLAKLNAPVESIALRRQKRCLEIKAQANVKNKVAIKTPKPRIRARDCDQWIKKQNRHYGGVRKERATRPQHRRPIMAHAFSQAQLQRHVIHLMHRVLSLRTNASPFTLVLDDLNQRAEPLLDELVRRGLSRNVNVVVVAFEAKNTHPAIRQVPAWGSHTGDQILVELERIMQSYKESLVIVDSLYDLLNFKNVDMNTLFELVAIKYNSTLVGVYHTDLMNDFAAVGVYAPQPLDVVKYMATTVITCKSLAHVLAAKAAKERSLPEPTFGLLTGAEGIVQSLDANDTMGIVLEAEFRRKSGRPESETYFLRPARNNDYNEPLPGAPLGTLKQEYLILLDQVPAYASKEVGDRINAAANELDVVSSFNLELTDKQRAARENVVLPYFDAQKGEGGEGGRILYDMGSEDDFDEEEDEI